MANPRGPAAAGSSARCGRPHRRAPRQSRHARGHGLLADAALPERVPLRPPRHRIAAPRSGSRSCRASCCRRGPTKSGALYALDLEPRTERVAAPVLSRARRPRSFRPSSLARSRSSSTGRCATASRRSASGSMRSPQAGCERILVFPLYPQYSATTTATVNDKAFDALKTDAPAAGAAHRAAPITTSRSISMRSPKASRGISPGSISSRRW